MVGDLIMLPLRLCSRSAQLVTRTAVGATKRAVSLAGHAVQTVAPSGADRVTSYAPPPRDAEERPQDAEERPQDAEERPQDAEEQRPAEPSGLPSDLQRELVEDRTPTPAEEPLPPRVPTSPPGAAAPIETPGAEEPAHVFEEPQVVREEAERGAEEGAGAAVSVMEPWEGYAQMGASEVTARIESASAAEVAAVRLYESRHRGRQTVLAAADRQLKTLNGGGGPA